MSVGGAGKRAEMPERARRVDGGTAEGTGIVRQAGTAREEYAGDGAPMLMEKVCARENLLAAYRRFRKIVTGSGRDEVPMMRYDVPGNI